MAIRLTFGLNGNAGPFQQTGWSEAEMGFTWSVGPRSRLMLPRPPGRGDMLLELHVRPFVANSLPGQRLVVEANDQFVDEIFLRDETVLSLRLPRIAGGDDRIPLCFTQPNACSPASVGAGDDRRVLGFAFAEARLDTAPAAPAFEAITRPPLPDDATQGPGRAVQYCTGLELADVAGRFESLGRNCEFGLVQRHFGAEPLGLLRFASITPPRLLAGLRRGFADIDAPGNLEVYRLPDDPSREFLLRDRTYLTESHTFENDETTTADYVLQQAERRFRLLHRKFIETLQEGDKICVFQHPHVRNAAIVRPIAAALASLGPNMLLWVAEGTGLPSGTVSVLQRGLAQGAIDHLAPPGSADKGDLPAWASILANAYRIWRQAGYGQKRGGV